MSRIASEVGGSAPAAVADTAMGAQADIRVGEWTLRKKLTVAHCLPLLLRRGSASGIPEQFGVGGRLSRKRARSELTEFPTPISTDLKAGRAR
jgi:hypothetical protein